MIIKEAVYKDVPSTRKELVSPVIYGCDQCKETFTEETSILKITVYFYMDKPNSKSVGDTEEERFEFCCWRCVFRFIPTIKTDHFVNLPFLMYDNNSSDIRDFMNVIKEIK